MSFSEDMQWWQEWQLRILALSSLFLQYFLFISSFLRKRSVPSWVRFFIWLAYVGSDAIALYALAALFNHPIDIPLGLKVLWAPILLVHLGGQDVITAYNIEDNELWKRHALTAMSQVTVAVYVFWKSWSADKRNSGQHLAAAILLFIPGILKCILKPWDLKGVSINSLVNSSGSEKEIGGIHSAESTTDENNEINSLEDFIQAANNHFLGQSSGADHQPNEELNKKPYDLFIDLPLPYSYRLKCLKHLEQNPSTVHWLLRSGLSSAFDLLYTKTLVNQHSNSRSLWDNFIDLIRVLGACCIFAVGVLVPLKQGVHIHTDVRITYILLYCTAALEYLTLAVIFSRMNQRGDQQQWPGQVSQYNLIWYLARNNKYNKLRKLATVLVWKDYMDQLWCMQPSKSSSDITNLVHIYLKAGWTERHIRDMATYRAFNDNRGQWTLEKEGCRNLLEWSLQRPFDESVILWHLATDFCQHNHITAPSSPSHQASFRSKEISNYMVYLLFVNPEMLMTGTRRSLFRKAYQQLKETLQIDKHHVEESEISQMKNPRINNEENRGNLGIVHDARRLANEIQYYRIQKGDKKMWSVIQGVWVEMLCFSAGRCRGYLHAKSLGHGGEYLSYIWLLLSYMGMETLGERMQRTNLQGEANDVASVVTTEEATSTDDTVIARAVEPAGGHADGPTEASTTIATGGGRREGAAQRRLNRLSSSPPATTAGRP